MSWDKISIKQGQEILKANALEPLDRDIKIVSIVYGKDVDYYCSIPRGELFELIKSTSWTNTMPEGKQAKPFYHGNFYYKFKTMPEQMSQSEFAMLQKYSQDEDLHRVLALLSTKYRIFVQKVCPMDFEARSELFLNKMSFGMAYAYCLFFSTYYPVLLNVGLHYSQGVKMAAQEFLKRKTPS